MDAAATAHDQGAAENKQLGALSQLIQDANDSGLSYGDMAARAVDPETGTRLVKQALQKLVKAPTVNPPTVPQMVAIANAIGRPLWQVKEAVAKQWLQYESTELVGYGNEVRIIVSHLAGMPDSEKRKWQAMIEAAERARREDEKNRDR
jgi:alkylated DNA nucleotide flippase Atl1